MIQHLKNFIWISVAAIVFSGAAEAYAQRVDARLSTREAYVGSPVVLQLSIENGDDFELPDLPEIDGCTIEAAGGPSQSSQITIINGRRSDSRSVTMQYAITPRREGTFIVPPLQVTVDGRTYSTRQLKFVATRSETGDLLFVEIEGGKDKVYVGEPLDLKLKIWVKPFRDRERGITLSEGQMWQLISNQTSWGSFGARLQELADMNRRPGGREELRDNGEGSQRGYYLYEIETTVYPTRPGQIDADDVQIVVNYPTSIGVSRDPFEEMLGRRMGRDPFGGANSLIDQMMNETGFPSMFGNRLAVTGARPIVADATVDATQVLPVPLAGQPADYRGAVGRYRIVTQATPSSVDAGDPITLNIGIAGSGPMELVQAPPLADLPDLTNDFKVSDQPLAGFVRDDTKVFSTTVRPRRAGITEIPPIPFSFFDPDTEQFETVYSDPISISVAEADVLSLDAIVGKGRQSNSSDDWEVAANDDSAPNFSIHESPDVLTSQSPRSMLRGLWVFLIGPPLIYLAVVSWVQRKSIARRLPSLRSAEAGCRSAIAAASNGRQIAEALTAYVSRRCRRACETPQAALGALRSRGFQQSANEMDSLVHRCEATHWLPHTDDDLGAAKASAIQLLDRLAPELRRGGRKAIKRPSHRSSSREDASSRHTVRRAGGAGRAAIVLALAGLTWSTAVAGESDADETTANSQVVTSNTDGIIRLSDEQRLLLFEEANRCYRQAMDAAARDTAESTEAFSQAADKYQLLIDSGVKNIGLYINAGNAYMQSGQLGQAIANYQRALKLDPYHQQAKVNLAAASELVDAEDENEMGKESSVGIWSRTIEAIRFGNGVFCLWIGMPALIAVASIASVTFWGLLISRAMGIGIPVRRIAWAPLVVLLLAGGSLAIESTKPQTPPRGIVVVDSLELQRGDSEAFEVVRTVENAEGRTVEILASRGDWLRVRTALGAEGWVRRDSVERI